MASIKLLHVSAYFRQNINDYEIVPGMAYDHVLYMSQHCSFRRIKFMYFTI